MNRYYGIEFLRLLTSLSVLLYHYRLFFDPYNPYSAYNFSDKETHGIGKWVNSGETSTVSYNNQGKVECQMKNVNTVSL